MRVALVHDWLITARGGERVLDALCELYPQADLYTLVHKPGSQTPRIESRRIRTSFLQHAPGILTRWRHYLPLYPAAIRSLKLQGPYDLVLSSSHAVAKAVPIPPGARHLSYVHAPMRYIWDQFEQYFGPGRARAPVRAAALAVRPFLQHFDVATASNVERLVANSEHIAGKLRELWGRDAAVVYPPVDLEQFAAPPVDDRGPGAGGYFLCLGALAPYKRVDIALEAFSRLGLPLKVVGAGQEASALRKHALPRNVELVGPVPDADLPGLYRGARALVFPGEEDFGITPLEAQACGRPVIALGRGGARETVTAQTGVFFEEQTVESLVGAVKRFEQLEPALLPSTARAQAERFSRAAFQAGIQREVTALLESPRARAGKS